jgi:hypothetical protein
MKMLENTARSRASAVSTPKERKRIKWTPRYSRKMLRYKTEFGMFQLFELSNNLHRINEQRKRKKHTARDALFGKKCKLLSCCGNSNEIGLSIYVGFSTIPGKFRKKFGES